MDSMVLDIAFSGMPSIKSTAPKSYVFIGDSLILGSNTGNYENITGQFARMRFLTDWFDRNGPLFTAYNMGVGGETTTEILARFAAALALGTEAVVVEGGINDIVAGDSEAVFLSNWTDMLDAVVGAGKTPVAMLLPPWTDATTARAETRDAWNVSLSALLAGYPTAKIADPTAYIGLYRAGGPEGNLWDIRAEYDYDGLHLVSAGYAQTARAVYDAL